MSKMKKKTPPLVDNKPVTGSDSVGASDSVKGYDPFPPKETRAFGKSAGKTLRGSKARRLIDKGDGTGSRGPGRTEDTTNTKKNKP